jgi:hypothetical protein
MLRLAPVQQKLAALDGCLGDDRRPYGLSPAHVLSLGLTYGWKTNNLKWGWDPPMSPVRRVLVRAGIPDSQLLDPPPQEYLTSLDQDLQQCELANGLPDDKKLQILAAVERDLEIKEIDCESFGMGRLVPVNVNTLRNGVPESGWEVLFKWMPAGPIPTTELASPDLSSPSVLHLVPGGTFQIRARRTGSDGKAVTSIVRTITITSDPALKCDIPL